MKKVFFIVTSAVLLFACKKDVVTANGAGSITVVAASTVPQAVIASFNSSFSTATETEWEHNGSDDSFICQFNLSEQRHEARFDDHGHQSSHSVICVDAPVPAVVLNAFRNSFPTDIVNEWNFTNENTWKAHFLRSGIEWEATYSAAGAEIKVEHD